MTYVEMIEDMTSRGWVVSIQSSLDEALYTVQADMPMGIHVQGAEGPLSQAVYNTYDLTLSVERGL